MSEKELRDRLFKYFNEKVQVHKEEKCEALRVWEEPVKKILQQVQSGDNRFRFNNIIYSGSFYERAKVKNPNEFDLMLEIENLQLGRWDPYDSDDDLSQDPPKGFTTVMIDQGEEAQWRPGGCIGNGNLLNSTKVKALFADHVNVAIRQLGYSHYIEAKSSGPAVTLRVTHHGTIYDIDLTLAIKDGTWPDDADEWKTRSRKGFTTVMIDQGEEAQWRPGGCIGNGNLLSSTNVKALFARYVHEAIRELGYSHCIEAKSSGPAVTLKVITNDNIYSIDLTLAIKDETWPDDADEWKTRQRRGSWPSRDLIAEIVRDGCHLVAKRPRQLINNESNYFWRYSFSAAEKKLALKGGHGEPGTCSKKVLRILKSLREKYKMNPLTSYHLKTIMFYEREENPHPSLWTDSQLATRFKSALTRLLRCLRNRKCPHYFIKDINLFDERFENCYENLIARVEDIQRYPQNYFR